MITSNILCEANKYVCLTAGGFRTIRAEILDGEQCCTIEDRL